MSARRLVPLLMIGGEPEDWGIIPSFLDTADPRPAWQQIDSHYQGGWNPMKGFSFDPERCLLRYPGDPPMERISTLMFRDETLILYPYAWVLILQPDDSWQVARLD